MFAHLFTFAAFWRRFQSPWFTLPLQRCADAQNIFTPAFCATYADMAFSATFHAVFACLRPAAIFARFSPLLCLFHHDFFIDIVYRFVAAEPASAPFIFVSCATLTPRSRHFIAPLTMPSIRRAMPITTLMHCTRRRDAAAFTPRHLLRRDFYAAITRPTLMPADDEPLRDMQTCRR